MKKRKSQTLLIEFGLEATQDFPCPDDSLRGELLFRDGCDFRIASAWCNLDLGEFLRSAVVDRLAEVQAAMIEEEIAGGARESLASEPEMILVPAGEFLVGSDPGVDKHAFRDELPQHTLYLPDYYLARMPVTNAQYAAFVQATGHRVPDVDADWARPYNWSRSTPPGGREDHPVVLVSWHDAIAYCNWLAKVTGKPYRLPSEVEWEKGARGSDGRIWPWGNEFAESKCNTSESGIGDTTEVGSYPDGASPYGAMDTAGNVWEWVADWYDADYYNEAPERNPQGPDSGTGPVLRGGSWGDYRFFARCAARYRGSPGSRSYDVGFRVAASPGSP